MESQSRYSIVERLTRQKLDIMDAKNDLDLNIINKKQLLIDKTKELESWKKSYKLEMKKDKQEQEYDIERVANTIKTAETRKAEKEKLYDAQIIELDNALKAIQSISKDAPTADEQS